MITLRRLSGSVFVLNADLIERIDQTPDSVVTLIDGKKYVVADSLEDIIEQVRRYRAQVIAISAHLADVEMPEQAPEPTVEVERPLASVAELRTRGNGEA